ncbi:MAG: cupin domain-containing protein [Fidelibacterota bacterium]
MTPDQLINLLQLQPLDIEGGFFRRTYTSNDRLNFSNQHIGSAIYYLITPESFSTIHKIDCDEIFHFYYGDPVEMLLLHPDGTGEIKPLSNQPGANFNPQQLVPKNTWQGCRLKKGGKAALLGATVFPEFKYENFVKGDSARLLEKYPEFEAMIKALIPCWSNPDIL